VKEAIAMIDFEGSLVIDASPDALFAFVSNPENIPHYQSKVVATRITSVGPVGQGTRFEETVAMGPGKMHVACEIVTFEAPRRVAFSARGKAVHCDAEYTFEPVPGGTRVRVAGCARLQGFRKVMEPLMRGQIRGGVRQELALIRERMAASLTTGPLRAAPAGA
jgi:uncharacterized protein YndB with AHSA1/START domain